MPPAWRKIRALQHIQQLQHQLQPSPRRLQVERQKIKECMGFCISKAAASAEIVETITESLTISETPVTAARNGP